VAKRILCLIAAGMFLLAAFGVSAGGFLLIPGGLCLVAVALAL
jgi:hypothetical protein